MRHPGLSDYSDVPAPTEPCGTFIALYAGAGGLDIGFALAGFAPVWVNDIDHHAVQTHERVFKQMRDRRPHLNAHGCVSIAGNVLDALDDDIIPGEGAADLVIGGPPCQGFSVAGKMDPRDERSKHVLHFFDVVERVRPRAFVMENVKALYSNSRWAGTRAALRARASELGYTAEMYLLDSSHFGVPQARERMVFVGVHSGVPVRPEPSTVGSAPTVRMAFAQLPRIGEPGNDARCTAKITPAKKPVLRRSPYAGMLFNGAGRPLDLDAPSLTLPASMGGNKTPIVDQSLLDDPRGESWVIDYHRRLWSGGSVLKSVPKTLRRITVQEAAAIQTFPIGMEWAGPLSTQFRQIGNAVPPRLALAVAQAVKQALGSS